MRHQDLELFRARDLKTASARKNTPGPSRFPLRTRSRFFPLVPSITKHPVCIEPTMNARWSYRFHNRRDKNSSSLVPRCPVSHTLSLSLFFSPPPPSPLALFLSLDFLSPQGSLMASWSRRVRRLTEQKTIDRTRSLGTFLFPQK